ncbi:RagB/SusD family nutrient uptake outer membrane protein [uncultured Bacteroides sp.]|uniref:RagB/SusD family nutrient uptake outer membrane protein n=1 Tax=uncultured Bacteroides sp. TaxID=162156 RepID=UPI00280A517A|nr:RagB/SusD family nutrient uptake outer membrane protein [uncultured Bacteroides sp.]
MNKIYTKFMLGVGLILSFASCSDILDEEPRNIFEPGFFETEQGVVGGLTGLYESLRHVYGQPYYYGALEAGTDEYTYGSQADGNFKNADLSIQGSIPDAANSRFDVLWNTAYSAINNASAIIDNGAAAGVADALTAEARFFRAFYYFQLVQSFGGVPLDLGSGELKANTTPSRVSTRNTVPEVYSRCIFPDLLKAINDLPEQSRLTGTVTKNVARLILAKAYLTYGWWLENPNNIPTYPECPRTDPDGKDKTWYFQQAYDISLYAIANPGPYALQPTFYDVHLWTNDRNKEIMLYADHNEDNAVYNEGNVTGWDGSPDGDNSAQNQAVWMVTWYFQNVQSSTVTGSWSGKSPFQRTVKAGQKFSRMWSRMAPIADVFEKAFAEKTLDSRFDATFVTTYPATYQYGTNPPSVLYNANYMPIKPGDFAVSFLPKDPGGIDYSNSVYKSNSGLGVLPGRADYVVALDKISRTVFPGLWKLGIARKGTDYNDDKVSSTRPFNILKFSEFYFIAAEAAVKGATGSQSARDLINVIRARAGKWTYSVAEEAPKNVDNSTAVIAATPATITIDYILDERSREYFGDGLRWYELARTQTWKERCSTYKISATVGQTPTVVPRYIETYMYLRPVPTSQLDRLEGDEAYKAAFQNPGYE